MSWLGTTLGQIRDQLLLQGPLAVLRAGQRRLLRSLVRDRTLDVLAFDLGSPRAAEPDLPGIELHVVRAGQQSACVRAARRALSDFDRRAPRKLAAGAAAICALEAGGLVHVTWTAGSARAQRAIAPIPFAVDYAGGEAFIGGAFTLLRARRRGLARRALLCALADLRARGARRALALVWVENRAMQRTLQPLGPRSIGRLRAVRLLRWELTRTLS